MAVKELKKILSAGWIIFLLVVLCAINIFLDINVTDSAKKEIKKEYSLSQKKIDGYETYVGNIRENADTIANFDIFDKGNNYQSESGKKIVRAYEKVKGVKPVKGNYVAIDKLVSFGFADVIVFLVMLQCAILLINVDEKCSMLTFLKSCKKGRTNLLLGKTGALLLTSVLVNCFVYISHGMALIGTYGCSSINVPIQSLSDFYESALPITVAGYLALFIVIKIFAVFAYSLIVFLMAVVFSNNVIVYSLSGLTIGVTVLPYIKIKWDYWSAIFKLLSPVTLTNVKEYSCKYYNVNIFGMPFSILNMAVSVIILYIVILTFLSVVIFSKNINVNFNFKKIVKFKSKNNKRDKKERKIKGITFMEVKKLLITNKGFIVILILVLLQGYLLGEINTQMDEYQRYYASYMNDLEGVQSKKSDTYIEKENARFANLKKEYKKNQKRYEKGEINIAALLAYQDEYQWNMAPYGAFKAVLKQQKYLNKLEKEQNIKGWFTNDIGINYVIHPGSIYSENIAWIFMLIAMIVTIVACMGYEEQTGMCKLTDTMINGTGKLFKAKLKVSAIVSLVIFAISNLPFLFIMLNKFSFSAVMAPLKSIREFEHFPINISILWFLIGLYILKFIIVLITMGFITIISRKCRGYVKKVAICTTVLIVPIIIFTIL
ncbi:hypothetical protein [Eubacterium sp.]